RIRGKAGLWSGSRGRRRLRRSAVCSSGRDRGSGPPARTSAILFRLGTPPHACARGNCLKSLTLRQVEDKRGIRLRFPTQSPEIRTPATFYVGLPGICRAQGPSVHEFPVHVIPAPAAGEGHPLGRLWKVSEPPARLFVQGSRDALSL